MRRNCFDHLIYKRFGIEYTKLNSKRKIKRKTSPFHKLTVRTHDAEEEKSTILLKANLHTRTVNKPETTNIENKKCKKERKKFKLNPEAVNE